MTIRNRAVTFCIILAVWCPTIDAAEYSDGDIIPEVSSILFTRDSVALTLQSDYSRGADRTQYFQADRAALEFRQISAEQFAELQSEDHSQDYAPLYERHDFAVTIPEVEACLDHSDPERACKEATTKKIDIENRVYNVDMLTTTVISDAKVIDGELWLATFEQGGHGEYSAEGVLIASYDDHVPQHLDVGYGVAKAIAVDPWSKDIWIVTGWQLVHVSRNKNVLQRFWPFHDMSKTLIRPGVFVEPSDEPIISNPLALFAYALGERSYEALTKAAIEGVDLYDPNPLSSFYMFGNYFTHRPQLPEELTQLLDVAEPTYAWRKFACMLRGERAKALCTTELDSWPANDKQAAIEIPEEK